MAKAVLDPETVQNLRELAGDDLTFIPQIVDLFLKNAAEKLVTISESLKAGKFAEAAALCHQLKSSSGNLGALELGKAFAALEQAALAKNAGTAAILEARLRALYPIAEAALRALIKNHEPAP